jgi:dienelactone hydrolase
MTKRGSKLALIFSLLALSACGRPSQPSKQNMSERITFQTEDNVTIVGDFVDAKSSKVVLFLHMMPATKESWRPLADLLAAKGVSSLAIDMRGHGGSTNQAGQKLDYQTFTDIQHQASAKDVEAALLWLKNKGFTENSIGVVGASFGANLALQTLGYQQDIHTAVAISPGLDYRGLQPAAFITTYQPSQHILFIASRDDIESAETTEAFAKRTTATADLILLDNAGHGTNIFTSSAATLQSTADWISKTLTL